jgi:dUTP pyrophosphatase
MDLRAAIASPIELAPGGRALIPTGIRIALAADHEAQVRPRSGLALKQGLTVLNAPGTIDADYRGEISVILINHSSAPTAINRGDRIAQLVIAPIARIVWREEPLDETVRGTGGFGSTGVED